MATLTGLSPSEMARIKWCQGCRWLSVAGQNGCCEYFFYHDHRRPCAFGKGCTVKETGRVKRVWQITPKAKTVPKERSKPKNPRAPRKIWNTTLARELFEQGVAVEEICERVGIGRKTLARQREKEGWVRQAKVVRRSKTAWDVEEARRLYEAEGVGPTALAARYGMAVSTIQMYAGRHGWKRGSRAGKE